MAGIPGPQIKINPALLAHIRATRRPIWSLATLAGFLHVNKFSGLINSTSVPDTDINRERLYKIADCVGFDKTQIFLDGAK